ncbi:hypothetical protein, partial [Ferrovum myxofaciens]|uniref:hypothetical protein n=1 Tax=Ferrovum myxofaciens TaxID=416213 RepID=UPI001D0D0B0C
KNLSSTFSIIFAGASSYALSYKTGVNRSGRGSERALRFAKMPEAGSQLPVDAIKDWFSP